MNLQLVSPFKVCPYKCPHCVSALDEPYPYENLYESNHDTYMARLQQLLMVSNYKSITITGMTEPTLFPEWITEVFTLIKKLGIKSEITLQTHDYTYGTGHWQDVLPFDFIAYSVDKPITKLPPLLTTRQYKKVTPRLVIIDNKSLDLCFYEQIAAQLPHWTQVTVKAMQETSNGSAKTDAYIRSVRRDPVRDRLFFEAVRNTFEKNKQHYRFDAYCLDSEGRYVIFREDGNLYKDWSTRTPVDF